MRKKNEDLWQAFPYLVIVIGVFMISTALFREKIKSIDDLKAINATLSGSGIHTTQTIGYHGRITYTYSYYVHLFKYANDFEIMGVIGKDFDKDNFVKEVNVGDSLTILIPKSDFNNIATKRNIRIFGVLTHKTTYMNYNNCIEEYDDKGGFVVFGIIFLIAGYFLLQRNKNKENLKRFEFSQMTEDD